MRRYRAVMRTAVGRERPVAGRAIEARGSHVPFALDAAVFATIVVLGLVTVFLPYTGDQALFARAAREIGRGAVYYRDFWDIKQPGIYWWFVGAGGVSPGHTASRDVIGGEMS